jgi:DNA-binding PadR family transcriptional regulator
MEAGRVAVSKTPMQSLVNWALLGLVVERESYAYQLAQRFERMHDGALSLSSVSHVYTALGTLDGHGLIEEVAGSRSGRQPKPRYRATAKGVAEHRAWLIDQLVEDRRRKRLFVVQLAALARDPAAALDVLAHCEEACLEELRAIPLPSASPSLSAARVGTPAADGHADLLARMLAEESRLTIEARLSWVHHVRGELEELAAVRAPGR